MNVSQKLYELFLAYPVKKVPVITETTKGAFSPTIQEYIRDVQFPRLLADTNIRYVATVKPSDLIAQMCIEVWEEELKSGATIVLHDVASEKEAREWLSRTECSA